MKENTHKALLVVAHGSRRQPSNDEIRRVTAQVAEQSGERFVCVECAFLELADPSIEAGVDRCVTQGADDITVVPYFLSAGRHVVEDVPKIIQSKQQEYPQITIRFSTYLGASSAMSELILNTVDSGNCLCGKAQTECTYPVCLHP